ncbi:unnamed protein product [Rangifer tarandus platyrhynchus]|uniref:Uncharacterized protein n=1 Tax=Rangifer tarandus platyrhynchus TaxID=3082113 RepID=A0AC59Z2F2_RANTA
MPHDRLVGASCLPPSCADSAPASERVAALPLDLGNEAFELDSVLLSSTGIRIPEGSCHPKESSLVSLAPNHTPRPIHSKIAQPAGEQASRAWGEQGSSSAVS